MLLVSQQFKKKIQGVFMNYYEDGNEFAPYHSDKYGCDSVLLSFGTERILRFKNNRTKENTDFNLNSGDLLFVPDEINKYFKHSLLKRSKVSKPRI
jgi:alkylated DNA repair dioxygenase AlkB